MCAYSGSKYCRKRMNYQQNSNRGFCYQKMKIIVNVK